MLDIGCGNKKLLGAIGVDLTAAQRPMLFTNLNSFPYLFEDSSFDEIYLNNTLEHLDDVSKRFTAFANPEDSLR